MQYHPASELLPLMSGEAFDELVASIKEDGLVCPIELYKGKILDGRNRYRACLKAGVEPEFVEAEPNDPYKYVMALNVARRHLNESQRAMVAARYSEAISKGKTTEKNTIYAVKTDVISPPKGGGRNSSLKTKYASAALNVSERSVERAKRVIERGAKSLQSAVDSGKFPVTVASKLADLPKRDQTAVMARANPRQAAKEALDEATPEKVNPNKWKVARSKARKTAEALQRAVDDLHEIKPRKADHKRLIALGQEAVTLLGNWE